VSGAPGALRIIAGLRPLGSSAYCPHHAGERGAIEEALTRADAVRPLCRARVFAEEDMISWLPSAVRTSLYLCAGLDLVSKARPLFHCSWRGDDHTAGAPRRLQGPDPNPLRRGGNLTHDSFRRFRRAGTSRSPQG